MKARAAKPKATQYRLGDGEALLLLVKPNGSKLWRFTYTFGGARKTLSFGTYPVITLSEARDQRHEARRKIAQGVDPLVAKAQERASQV